MTWTLLMRLEGPMQAWGVQSRFEVRDTGTEPSKSGVIGLVCAALGRDRSEPIDDLRDLRMGVRLDRPGSMMRDYQTAVRWKWNKRSGRHEAAKTPTLSERFYLADASFLVGLEGEDRSLLASIDDALRRPKWPLSLGRRAFPPSKPLNVPDGLVADSLESALRSAPLLSLGNRATYPNGGDQLRLVIEHGPDQQDGLVIQRRPDQPVSFEPRRFTSRNVIVSFIDLPPQTTEEVSRVSE